MKKNKVLKDIKALITKTFADHEGYTQSEYRDIVDGAVYTGEDDPGQWSPNAVAVVHCESGIPSGLYDDTSDVQQMWIDIDEELRELGHDIFVEDINAAVKAYYKI